MNAALNVNNYLETVLLMIGWVINNALWSALMQTGLALLPFVVLILSEWYKVRQEGEDEGNKGTLLVTRIETRLYAMVLCYAFTCVPLMTLSFNPVNALERKNEAGQSCNVAVIGEGQWGSSTVNVIDGQTADIPLWWALVHAVSKGLTNTAVAAIPCTTDLQAITSEIDAQTISDPVLLQELGEFQQFCFGAARSRFFQQGGTVSEADAEKIDWLGSEYFLDTPGYYDDLYAGRPMPGFPYDAARDEARPNTGPGRPGVPSCKQWWNDGDAGLYTRLHNEVDPGVWDGIRSVFSSTDAEGEVIRRLIQQRSGSANGNQQTAVRGYGDIGGDAGPGDVVSWGAGMVGGAAAALLGTPGMDMLKRALPMVQYILIMAVVVCLPFVMTVSGYSFKVAGTATLGLFALFFLTFWWELARWINASLTDLIYNSDAAKMSFLAAGENMYDRLVLVFVQWATFLILPGIWVAALGWTGMRVGDGVSKSLTTGTAGAKGAGDKGSNMAEKAATKGKG